MIDFDFINIRRENPATKSGEFKLNDLLEIKHEDKSNYRIYLNNSEHYLEIPANKEMLKELTIMTWTLDNLSEKSKLVHSNSFRNKPKIYMSELLKKYDIKEGYNIYPNENDEITEEEYLQKKKEFRMKYNEMMEVNA